MKPVLYVISGAGLSAESGVPTFRTAGGIWEQVDKNRVCNFHTWKRYRTEVFEFYADRRRQAASVQPNGAHLRLAKYQTTWGLDRVQLLTQNVDDLLEQAGCSVVTHLHGDLRHLLCTACSHRWPTAEEEYHEGTRCPECNSLNGVKPGVVLFNEQAPEYLKLIKMVKALTQEDILLVIGSSMEVLDADFLMPRWRVGHDRNWQVNPEPVQLGHFGLNVAKNAVAGLEELEPKLVELMDA